MTRLRIRLSIKAFLFVIALAAFVANAAPSSSVQTQEADRVLEIERYPDEPYEFVDLKIGTASVKDRVKRKWKDESSQWAIDRVTFKEQDDWYRRLSITVRNKTEKPIYGLQATLLFKPLGYPMMFSLPLTRSRELRPNPLHPGDEIHLSVSEEKLNLTLANVKDRGVNLINAEMSLSLDAVIFNEESQWYRGKMLRPDATTPGKWVPAKSTP